MEEEGEGGARLGAVIDSRRAAPIGQQAGKWNQGHDWREVEGKEEGGGRMNTDLDSKAENEEKYWKEAAPLTGVL